MYSDDLLQKLRRDQIVSQRRRNARLKVTYERNCVICGKQFISRTGSAKYCSDACRPVYNRK